jgi:RNA ligase partner protein
MEAESGLGKNSKEVMLSLYNYGLQLGSSYVQFYMPPAILDEVLTFLPETDENLKKLLSVVQIKSPEISNIKFSAKVFYTIVKDIRERSYRGLTIAEEELANAVKDMSGKTLDHIEHQKQIGKHVTKLRERYRNATRTKFLDSVADLDLIVLAQELDASVVSSDEGIMIWARLFGVKETKPQFLKDQLETLLHQATAK